MKIKVKNNSCQSSVASLMSRECRTTISPRFEEKLLHHPPADSADTEEIEGVGEKKKKQIRRKKEQRERKSREKFLSREKEGRQTRTKREIDSRHIQIRRPR